MAFTGLSHNLAEPGGLPRLSSRYRWQTFCKDLSTALLVPAAKPSRLQMNLNWPSLPR
jgi:hypothetical protein